jgi:hypothetical protein
MIDYGNKLRQKMLAREVLAPIFQFSRFKGEPLRSLAVCMHTSTPAAIWKRQRSQLRVLQHELSVHAPSILARTAEFP